MTKAQVADLLLEAYKQGYGLAVATLADTQRVHDWMGQFDRADIYDLMPSARRSAIAYLQDQEPDRLPAEALK
jgi:3-phenylpropionate/cinnamic acid dioxygenase small subunit